MVKEFIVKGGKTTSKYHVRINKSELNEVIKDITSTSKLNKKITIEVKDGFL